MQIRNLPGGHAERNVSDPLAVIRGLDSIECGEQAAQHFDFDESYVNLNHGSYGSTPNEVMQVHRYFRTKAERRPDAFVRYEYRTHLLAQARQTVADYLSVPLETCVLVQNATIAFDTIVRNLVFRPGDVVICFDPVYDAFYHTLQYLNETTPVAVEKINYTLPQSDRYICDAFEQTVERLRQEGKRPVLALFDTVSSLPAARMPFERLTALCKANNILSCIDGAHGIGQFPLDLTALDPDFFTSNNHKWLHVPRPCGMLYVPLRNQHLLRATIPTGFNFVPQPGVPQFAPNFASLSTLDDTPNLCIEAALLWRSKLTWNDLRGEAAIMAYTRDLASKGGSVVASLLETEVLDNAEGTLGDSSMTNVRLPLDSQDFGTATGADVARRAMKAMILDQNTALNVFAYREALWVRLSAQVYLTLADFERAAQRLSAVCELVRNGTLLR